MVQGRRRGRTDAIRCRVIGSWWLHEARGKSRAGRAEAEAKAAGEDAGLERRDGGRKVELSEEQNAVRCRIRDERGQLRMMATY